MSRRPGNPQITLKKRMSFWVFLTQRCAVSLAKGCSAFQETGVI